MSMVDPVELARSLGPLIRAEAGASEAATTLTAPIVDALKDSNLFNLFVPVDIGGAGADTWTVVEVIEQISRADCSTGWCYMANVIGSAVIVTRLGEAAVKEIYGRDEPAIFAGMPGPTGTGRPVDGGWIVNGTFSFASGSEYATWLCGGVQVDTESGPELLAYIVPREQTECLGNWNVQGLVATGSYDYAVHDLFVPNDFTFWNNPERGLAARPRWLRTQPSLSMERYAQATTGHLGVALGTAQRALEEITLVADGGKQRRNAPAIRDQQLYQHAYVIADAKFRSARAYAKETIQAAIHTLTEGTPNTETESHRVIQACCWAVQCAVEVVEFAYYWSGTQGLRAPHPLGRIARDMILAQNQHLLIDTTMLTSSFPGVAQGNRVEGDPSAAGRHPGA